MTSTSANTASVNSAAVPHTEYHKDGSVLARGQKLDGLLTGYWEWFRKDGTIMRSGYFEKGEQTGLWTTYDAAGEVHKVTRMKPRKAAMDQADKNAQ